MSHNNLWLILLLLAFPVVSSAEVHVNDSGTWKAPTEIHVNDGGTWKAAQEVHVNDAGVWTLVFTLTPATGLLKISFEWEIIPKDIVAATTYKTVSTAYALGHRVRTLGYVNTYAEITTAGTTSATYISWPSIEALASGDVLDNGDGTVNIPCYNTTAINSGDTWTIDGTANYDGTYALSTQATEGYITITHAYTAETILGGMAVEAAGLTVADGTAVWTIKEYARDITGYNIYLGDTVLCSATGKTEATLICNDVAALGQPANFSATFIHAVDGESLPSTKSWASGYPAWQASTVYALDDGVQAGANWAYSAPMKVLTAGTSGATEPTWPVVKRLSRQITLSGPVAESVGTVVDNGNGTVNIPCPGHGMISGDLAYISGTENYDTPLGTYTTLPSQTDPDVLTLTASYVAETLSADDRGNLPSATNHGRPLSGSAINNGDGTVNLPCAAHGFVGGDSIYIYSTTSYSGSYVLSTQGNPDQITITKTYVAETFATGDERAQKGGGSYRKNMPPPGTFVTSTGHGVDSAEAMTISGTTSYDGLANAIAIDADTLYIHKPFIAETVAATAVVYSAPAVNNLNGKISLPCLDHGFVAGDEVTISGTGTTTWDGVHVLGTQADPDAITITATFIIKDVSGAAVAKKVTDGSVVWELTYE